MTDKLPKQTLSPSDPWTGLRGLTAARIGLERSGASLSTAPLLEFRLAHARARDAVHEPLDVPLLLEDLGHAVGETLAIRSAAETREQYLMRPDLGRRLSSDSAAELARHSAAYDLVLAIADGLSARAIQMHAPPVIAGVLSNLRCAEWRIAPLVVVRHGRVAICDEIAQAFGANCVVALIGERPGLSAPDSMGAYLTWLPSDHTTNADRNCISNIRPDGIDYVEAANKIAQLISAMRTWGMSGIQLKDHSNLTMFGVSTKTDKLR